MSAERPPRDSQRSKVYAAEDAFFRPDGRKGEVLSMAECEAIIRLIEKTPLWNQLCDRGGTIRRTWRPVIVEPGRSGGFATGYSNISLGTWARNRPVILHEMAHIATSRRYGDLSVQSHGWEFCDTYLKLVKRFMGTDAHDQLKASFKEHKVRIRPKATRNLTEAQRQALRDRLATIRKAS